MTAFVLGSGGRINDGLRGLDELLGEGLVDWGYLVADLFLELTQLFDAFAGAVSREVFVGVAQLFQERMNRIVSYDEQNAVMTVEPGVTFEQAAEFLRQQGSGLYLTAIGGPPDSSVLANALERGDGVGPMGDRAKYWTGLEVVLPKGECFHTGLEAFENSLSGKLAQFGLGPALEGLFLQSNLGIVTRTVEEIALRHNLEPMCMFFNMSQWYLKSFIVLMFDQEVPAEALSVRECHDEILTTLHGLGYSPVRLGSQSMHLGGPSEPAYIDLIRQLKHLLDPNDILPPGRYDFRHRWRA